MQCTAQMIDDGQARLRAERSALWIKPADFAPAASDLPQEIAP